LENSKGSISVGCDADLIIWSPKKTFTIEPRAIYHRHKLTPYANRKFAGVVETTFLHGRKIYDAGEFVGTPQGHLLLSEKAV
jgi:allantoinase